MKTIEIGQTVHVELPGGTYTGKVQRLMPSPNFTGEPWALITGDKPVPFETTTRVAVLTPA